MIVREDMTVRVSLSKHDLSDMKSWLRSNIEEGTYMELHSNRKDLVVLFTTEEDATLFRLRWL